MSALTAGELRTILDRAAIGNHWPLKFKKQSVDADEVVAAIKGAIWDEITWALGIKAREGGTVHECRGCRYSALLAGDDTYCDECLEAAREVLATETGQLDLLAMEGTK